MCFNGHLHAYQLGIYDPCKIKEYQDKMKAYLKGVYSILGGIKYILSDQGSEITHKKFDFWQRN